MLIRTPHLTLSGYYRLLVYTNHSGWYIERHLVGIYQSGSLVYINIKITLGMIRNNSYYLIFVALMMFNPKY